MWSFLPICCAGGFGFFSQGTCTNRINNLEVAIESCKTAETGGVGNLSQVFSKASEDVAAAKAGAEKLTTLEPSAVTQQDVDLAKEQQLVCRKHEEGLTKTLAGQSALGELSKMFNWQILSVFVWYWCWKGTGFVKGKNTVLKKMFSKVLVLERIVLE